MIQADRSRHVAIVTGAAGGLGAAVVRAVADQVDVVVGVDRDARDVERALPDVDNCVAVTANLEQWDQCERLVADTIERFGRVDVLVNAAAVLRRTELNDVGPEIFDSIVNINARSTFVLMRGALRDMETRGWGRIVNIVSVGVHTGGYSLTSAVYEATKAAVGNFTRTFARYAGPRGILVNNVAPGGMLTPMLTRETPPEVLARVEADIPLGRLAEPGEVASLVAYLAGSANTYASGATFDVNGGVVTP